MILRDWFQYSDRDRLPYNPTINTTITTEGFWRTSTNDFDSPDWRCEEWLIHSTLVPINQLYAAAEVLSSSYLTFETGWDDVAFFDFGEYKKIREIELYPWSFVRKHPVNQELIIELRQDFITYHCLEQRSKTEYYHPLENIRVAETRVDSHQIFDPTPRVTVHRDYLRDFLAAREMGLLISIVADRFANARTETELEIDEVDNELIADFTKLSTNIHTPDFTGHGYFRGRSILHRNLIIEPYETPKVERSPWHYFGELPNREGELPRFIVNSEGDKQTLSKNSYPPSYPWYLYFRPEVLQKYLQTPGYSVFFHMRNWGIASLPGDKGTVDVGINSQGMINAFAPDIADLSIAEQAYWASFSSLPSGEICEEMFQTRMQQNPPHSPGITELIRNARSQLNTTFIENFSTDLYTESQPSPQELCRLSVGPINSQFSEVLELSKILYGWVIETMQIDPLRAPLGGRTEENKQWGQIKLLNELLVKKGLETNQARSITNPLRGLNDLRVGSAHIGIPKLEKAFNLMGSEMIPQPSRTAWNWCVDAIAQCLNSIAEALKS